MRTAEEILKLQRRSIDRDRRYTKEVALKQSSGRKRVSIRIMLDYHKKDLFSEFQKLMIGTTARTENVFTNKKLN
jgi:hypothetical protein